MDKKGTENSKRKLWVTRDVMDCDPASGAIRSYSPSGPGVEMKFRSDWLLVGGASLIVGFVLGIGVQRYLSGELFSMVSAAAGSVFTAAVALFVIHYKQHVDSKQEDQLVYETVWHLYVAARVLVAASDLYAENEHDQLVPKGIAQAIELLHEIETLETHVGRQSIGSLSVRRGVLRLLSIMKVSRAALDCAIGGKQAGTKPDEQVMGELGNCARMVENDASRFLVAHGAFKDLDADEIHSRLWAVDHE
jgi:hypothetical protein